MHITFRHSALILTCLLTIGAPATAHATFKSSAHTFLKDKGGAAALGSMLGPIASMCVVCNLLDVNYDNSWLCAKTKFVNTLLGMISNFDDNARETIHIAILVFATGASVSAGAALLAHNGYVWLSDHLQKPTADDKSDALKPTSSLANT